MGLGSRKEKAADQRPRSCGELKPQQRFNAGSFRGFRAKEPEGAGDTDWPWIQTGKEVQAGSEESKGPPGGAAGTVLCAGIPRDVPGGSGSDWGHKGRPRGRWARPGSRGASQSVLV